jgi:hypothetical protein
VETFVPASAPIVNLFNTWAEKAYTVESLAVAAGQGTGTGAEKATMVLGAVAPKIVEYSKDAGVSPRTTAQIQAANAALIAFLNAMTSAA